MEIPFSNGFWLSIIFSSVPLKATNVSAITVTNFSKFKSEEIRFPITSKDLAMFAARSKCYDCGADVTYTSGSHTLVFHSLRAQAYLPHKLRGKSQFSPRDPDSVCSVSITGFDAALYFGIGIGVLGAIGIILYVRHMIVRRSPKSGYQSINDDE
jgi:hypothetical protein